MNLRHFVDTQDFTRAELLELIELIRLSQEAYAEGATPQLLPDASLAIIYEEGERN